MIPPSTPEGSVEQIGWYDAAEACSLAEDATLQIAPDGNLQIAPYDTVFFTIGSHEATRVLFLEVPAPVGVPVYLTVTGKEAVVTLVLPQSAQAPSPSAQRVGPVTKFVRFATVGSLVNGVPFLPCGRSLDLHPQFWMPWNIGPDLHELVTPPVPPLLAPTPNP